MKAEHYVLTISGCFFIAIVVALIGQSFRDEHLQSDTETRHRLMEAKETIYQLKREIVATNVAINIIYNSDTTRRLDPKLVNSAKELILADKSDNLADLFQNGTLQIKVTK